MTSNILDVVKIKKAEKWWLILSCGHWYKWTGPAKPPKANTQLDCPSHGSTEVVGGSDAH